VVESPRVLLDLSPEYCSLTADQFCRLLQALVCSPRVQSQWQISDRGMPVFAHTIDVALLCLDAYPDWRERFPDFRLDVVLIGCLLHDLTKVNARIGDGLSHSHIMTHEPAIAAGEAMSALDEVQSTVCVWLDQEGIDHVWHVVAAHHGRWGKVAPRTPEAALVHQSDNYSATHHRTAPVDANDVLPLLDRGYKWAQIGQLLGVSRAIVKSRLQDACRAERVRSTTELLGIWREQGAVRPADDEHAEQIERARFIVDFARRCPESLLERVRPCLPVEEQSLDPVLGW
jgi:hypothetical protein